VGKVAEIDENLTNLPALSHEDLEWLHLQNLLPFFIFNVGKVTEIDENLTDLPELDNEDSERLIVRYRTAYSKCILLL
jgi:hypothetical protein